MALTNRVAFLALLLVGASVSLAFAQSVAGTKKVLSCKDTTLTQPETGFPYRGVVKNEDYHFTATVPAGMTGWGGVADGAPFHGFTIFLDPRRHSCIVFEIHLRVDDDAHAQPAGTTTISLGQAEAWQETAQRGSVRNLKTTFSFDNHGDTEDGSVLLVSATPAQWKRAKAAYDALTKSIRFGGE